MPPVRFEPTISEGVRPQTYALDRATTGTGDVRVQSDINFSTFGGTYCPTLPFEEGLFYPEMLKLLQVTVRISEDFILHSRRHEWVCNLVADTEGRT